MRPSEIPLLMVSRSSLSSLDLEESTAVLRSILVFKLLEVPKRRPPPKVLMDSVRDAPNTTLWDADSLNGELYSKSEKGYLQM